MASAISLRATLEAVRGGAELSERKRRQFVARLDDAYRRRALERLKVRLAALPWWAVAAGLQGMVLILAGLLAVAAPPTGSREDVVFCRTGSRLPAGWAGWRGGPDFPAMAPVPIVLDCHRRLPRY